MKTGKLRNKILAFALPLTLVPFLLTALAVYYFVVRSYQSQIEDEQKNRSPKAFKRVKLRRALACNCSSIKTLITCNSAWSMLKGKSESSSANCRNQTSSRSRTKICSEECLLPGLWTRKFKCRWKLFGQTNSLRCLPGGFDERNSPAWLSSI